MIMNTCQKYQPQWVVVQFLKDSSVSTIPSKWLKCQTDENETLECFWPTKKIRQKIQNACDADEQWQTFPVEILQETDDYAKAKCFEKTCSEEESSDTTTEEESKTIRKRKIPKSQDFVSGNSSEEELYSLPPLPKIPKKMDVSKTHNDCILIDQSSDKDSTGNGNDTSSTSSTLSLNGEIEEMDKIIMPPPLTTKIPRKPAETEKLHLDNNDEPDCCCVHVRRMNEHVVALRTLLDEHIINLKKIIPSQTAEPITAFDTIPQNAFLKYNKLIKYEENLKNSSETKKQLETLFYIGGGNCPNEMIKRGLIRIFSNKLARKCSWYGRKENYPLNLLAVISTLRDADRKLFSAMTDSDFERFTSTWFRQAALRYKREENK